jgi:hypothetical protein
VNLALETEQNLGVILGMSRSDPKRPYLWTHLVYKTKWNDQLLLNWALTLKEWSSEPIIVNIKEVGRWMRRLYVEDGDTSFFGTFLEQRVDAASYEHYPPPLNTNPFLTLLTLCATQQTGLSFRLALDATLEFDTHLLTMAEVSRVRSSETGSVHHCYIIGEPEVGSWRREATIFPAIRHFLVFAITDEGVVDPISATWFAGRYGLKVGTHPTLHSLASKYGLECHVEVPHFFAYREKVHHMMFNRRTHRITSATVEMVRGMHNLFFAAGGRSCWVGAMKVAHTAFPEVTEHTSIFFRCLDVLRHAIRAGGLKTWMVQITRGSIVRVSDRKERERALTTAMLDLALVFCYMTRLGRAMFNAGRLATSRILFVDKHPELRTSNYRMPLGVNADLSRAWGRVSHIPTLLLEAVDLLSEAGHGSVLPERDTGLPDPKAIWTVFVGAFGKN